MVDFPTVKGDFSPISEIRPYRLGIISLYGKYIDFPFEFKKG